MKKIGAALLLLLFLFSVSGISSYAKETESQYQFSPKEKSALELIDKVKQFEKKLDFKETKNFLEFDPEADTYRTLHYKEKTKAPFSYIDPGMEERPVLYDNLKENLSFLESVLKIDVSKYDFHLRQTDRGISSGGSPITKEVLDNDPERIVYLVLHEDWHDNVDLPLHIEEASGELIGYLGMLKFFGRDQEIDQFLQKHLGEAIIINKGYEKLYHLSLDYSTGKIDKHAYELKKGEITQEINKKLSSINPGWNSLIDNPTIISVFHSYTYYFPLMYNLYYALGADFNKTIYVLKNIPLKKPLFFSSKSYFEKTRKTEKQIEIYLENIIQNSNAKKNKPVK